MGLILAFLLCASAQGPSAAEDAASAARLAAVLDGMDVERRWPAGVHVDWETGVPDGKPERGAGKHTHCSAFVGSAAKRLGVYILRPPEHGQLLLANAQYDWLAIEGPRRGWTSLPDDGQAQAYANRGYLVVAAYRNHHDDKPGHIAIVRPSARSAQDLVREGPEIIQAGGTNYAHAALKRGFAGHPAAWSQHEVRYYAHVIDWRRQSR